jgi:uncharacterized protein (TIGR02145 family)
MRRSNSHPYTLLAWSACLAGLLSLASCTDTDYREPSLTGDADRQVAFIFSVDDSSISAVTRSLSTDNENTVSTVDLLLFRSDDTDHRFYRTVSASLTDAGTNTFQATIPVGTYDVELLTNARSLIASAGLVSDEPKATALARLTRSLTAGARWTDTAIPAWAELTNQSFTQAVNLTGDNAIRPVRMLARIDVKLSDTAAGTDNANFALHSVRLYNYSTRGALCPDLSVTGLWNGTDHTVTLPTRPSGAATNAAAYLPAAYSSGAADNSATGALLFGADDDTDSYLPDSLVRAIYTFEAPAGSAATPETNTCLVIGGSYKGSETDTYYRIDLTAPTDGAYLPLLRNHLYRVTVTHINRAGQPTADDAFSAVATGLTATVLNWNQASMDNVTFDGIHYLSVARKQIYLPYIATPTTQSTDTTRLSLHTDCAVWTARACADAAGTTASSWLTLAYNGSTGSSVSGIATGTPSDAAAELLPIATANNGTTARTAYILLTAGRLTYTIPVTQRAFAAPATGQFAYSNIILRDGKLTFAATAEENEYIPAESQGVYFTWGSLVALDPTKSFDASSSVVFTPPEYTGTTISNWASVPYDNGTAPLVGYNGATATGDVCRYITDHQWVKGSWRMPTNDEYTSLVGGVSANYGTFAAETSTQNNGTYQLASGKLISAYVYLPASGNLDNVSGQLYKIGQEAHYWTNEKSYNMFFNRDQFMQPHTNNIRMAFPVRCVADSSPAFGVSDAMSGNQDGTYTPTDAVSGTQAFTYAGGSHDFTVKLYAIESWSATVSDGASSWLSVSPSTGSSYGTLTVTAAANTVSTAQSGTVTVTAGGKTFTLTVTLAAGIPTFAYSNIIAVPDASQPTGYRLSFATTAAQGSGNIPQQSQGIFFRWGSLVGADPTSASPLIFQPSEYTTTVSNITNAPYTNADANLSGYTAASGIGDICQYISDKGWVAGTWRMPTQNEIYALYSSGHTTDATWSPTTSNQRDGSFIVNQGWTLGASVGTTSQRYFPASGYRGTDGSLETLTTSHQHVQYWLSTIYGSGAAQAYRMFGHSTALDPTSHAGVTDFYSIRCVRSDATAIPDYISVTDAGGNGSYTSSSKTLSFDATGGTRTFAVVDNTGTLLQGAAVNGDWLAYQVTNPRTISIMVPANNGISARTATFTFNGKSATAITVTQSGSTPTFTVTPDPVQFAATNATAQTFTVNSNLSGNFAIAVSGTGFSSNKTTVAAGGTFTVSAADNGVAQVRTGTLTVTPPAGSTGVSTYQHELSQAAAGVVFEVTPATTGTYNANGGKWEFFVKCNLPGTISISSADSWLTPSPTSISSPTDMSNGARFYTTAAPNTATTTTRSTTLTVSIPGAESIKRTISQAGGSLSIAPTNGSYTFSAAGETKTFSVTNNTGVTPTITKPSWATSITLSGDGKTITVVCPPNTTSSAHPTAAESSNNDVNVVVTVGSLTAWNTVSQPKGEITTSASTYQLPATAGSSVNTGISVSINNGQPITATPSGCITAASISGGKLIVSYAANTTTNAPTGKVVFSSGTVDTKTVNFTQEGVTKPTPFAYSNIFMDGNELSFFEDEDGGDPYDADHYQGIYFKRGSLIGISPIEHNSQEDWEDVYLYIPNQYGAYFSGSPSSYSQYRQFGDIPCIDDGSDVSSAENNTPEMWAAGKGDVCQFITNKAWRLPTQEEFGENSDWEANYHTGHYGNLEGTYNIPSGVVNKQTGSFFPASSGRDVNGIGTWSDVGENGFYWSGTSSFNFITDGDYFSVDVDAGSSDGTCTVRCVRNK